MNQQVEQHLYQAIMPSLTENEHNDFFLTEFAAFPYHGLS